MSIVIKILGILFIFLAIVYLVKPGVIKSMMEFFKRGKRIYLVGLIRLVLAIVFLLAARECAIPWVIVTFGILMLVSGLLIFMLGPKKLSSIIDWWQKRSPLILRLLAVITLAIGAIIIYSA